MKILLAFLAIALAAALLVSATMGAETLVPGGGSANKKPSGAIMASPAGRARLLPVSLAPLMLKGSGFKAGETVTVRSTDNAVKSRRTVKATAAGTFVVRMGTSADRCNGGTIVAVGDKGSRASLNFSQVVCAAPAPQG
jgi:hypothetical protein